MEGLGRKICRDGDMEKSGVGQICGGGGVEMCGVGRIYRGGGVWRSGAKQICGDVEAEKRHGRCG
jgi:hypothetical protein